VEPITAAIVAALASGLGSVTNTAVKDAYSALKMKLSNMLSSDSDAVVALQSLEKKPDSSARQNVLNEELLQANLEQSADIQQLLKNLLENLSQTEFGKEAMSKYNINADKIGVVGDNTRIKNQSF
jgi:hypothetical protein